jgi:hypothetical protein
MDLRKLKKKICEPKVSRLLPNVCGFQKENHTLGYGLKIYSPWIFFLCDFHICSLNRLMGLFTLPFIEIQLLWEIQGSCLPPFHVELEGVKALS